MLEGVNKVEAEVKVEEELLYSLFLAPFLRQGMPCSIVPFG
jgi:hypothetical protein